MSILTGDEGVLWRYTLGLVSTQALDHTCELAHTTESTDMMRLGCTCSNLNADEQIILRVVDRQLSAQAIEYMVN